MLLPRLPSVRCLNEHLPFYNHVISLTFMVDFADDFKGPNHIVEMLLSTGRTLLTDSLN